MDKYLREEKLGEGTYAVVYKARPKALTIASPSASTTATTTTTTTTTTIPPVVAIKKIKMGQFRDGMDMSAIREIKFLKELDHPNIIRLYDVFVQRKNVHLVLEFLESDLEMVIKEKSVVFTPSDIKSWMWMTLRGLEHCHRCWILHRDLKPNNLLIASSGELKIADFGLARVYGEPVGNMTTQVVTRWYRAPELLYGARDYTVGVDMWALGCIFAELMLRVPYMAGETDMDQLQIIFRARGTPTEKEWPGMKLLPDYVQFGPFPKPNMRHLFSAASEDALALLQQMLAFDPMKRISAKAALEHAYFKKQPHPTLPAKLPRVAGRRELSQETDHAQAATRQQDFATAIGKTKRKVDDTSDLGTAKVARKLF